MAEEIPYNEIILSHGFTFWERCTCGGSLQDKYRKGAWVIKVFFRKKPRRFTAKIGNQTMKVANLIDLSTYLNSIS